MTGQAQERRGYETDGGGWGAVLEWIGVPAVLVAFVAFWVFR